VRLRVQEPWEPHQFSFFWIFLFYFILLASIAKELDRERLRNLRGETVTEFVRNSKVLVDFVVRT
jgi:hypothetical protein